MDSLAMLPRAPRGCVQGPASTSARLGSGVRGVEFGCDALPVTRRPVLLLPPSEGKTGGGTGAWDPASGTFATLAGTRLKVAKALRQAMRGSIAARSTLLGVKGDALARATAINRATLGAPTLRAWERYRGVVFEHLDVASMSTRDRRRAEDHVIVLSGLLGAVTLGDPIPDYKVKMGARLGSLRVTPTWAAALRPVLDEMLASRDAIDLLPNEHAAAYVASGPRVIRVRFEQRAAAGVRRAAAGHAAKAAKGVLARALLTSAPAPDVLREFAWEGWSFDGRSSHLTADGEHTRTAVIVAP